MPRFAGIPVTEEQPVAPRGPRFKGIPVGADSTPDSGLSLSVQPTTATNLIPTQTEGDVALATYGFGGPASSTTKNIAGRDRDFNKSDDLIHALAQAHQQGDTGAQDLIRAQLRKVSAKDTEPTKGMTGSQKFAAGAGKAVVDTGRGIAQLATQGANLLTGGDLQAAVDASKQRQDAVAAQDAPLLGTGAGLAGNLAGYAALSAVPGAALRLAGKGISSAGAVGLGRSVGNVGSALALPDNYASAAAIGGAEGAAQPVGTGDSRWANLLAGAGGGVVGRAIPQVTGAILGAGARALPAFTEGAQNRRAANMLTGLANDPDQVRQALSALPAELVPGSRPTTAEVTGDVGLASLQRSLANLPEFSNELAQRRTQNNAARVAFVENQFGGANDAAADAVRSTRDRNALPLLNQAKNANGVDVGKVTALADRIIDKRNGNPAIQSTIMRVRGELAEAKGDVATMYNIRQFVDTLFKDSQDTAAKASRRELQSIKMAIDHEIGKVSPEFGQYLNAYRDGSRLADQVDVGSQILNASDANLDQLGNPVLSAAKVARFARDPDQLVQKATAFKRATAARILEPDQAQAVQDLSLDLSRQANTAVAGKAIGSNTVQNLAGMNSVQEALGPVGAAGIAGGPMAAVATAGLNRLRSKMGEKVYGVVRDAMLNPERAAEIFSQLPVRQRRQVLVEYGPALGIAASQPLVRAAFQSE